MEHGGALPQQHNHPRPQQRRRNLLLPVVFDGELIMRTSNSSLMTQTKGHGRYDEPLSSSMVCPVPPTSTTQPRCSGDGEHYDEDCSSNHQRSTLHRQSRRDNHRHVRSTSHLPQHDEEEDKGNDDMVTGLKKKKKPMARPRSYSPKQKYSSQPPILPQQSPSLLLSLSPSTGRSTTKSSSSSHKAISFPAVSRTISKGPKPPEKVTTSPDDEKGSNTMKSHLPRSLSPKSTTTATLPPSISKQRQKDLELAEQQEKALLEILGMTDSPAPIYKKSILKLPSTSPPPHEQVLVQETTASPKGRLATKSSRNVMARPPRQRSNSDLSLSSMFLAARQRSISPNPVRVNSQRRLFQFKTSPTNSPRNSPTHSPRNSPPNSPRNNNSPCQSPRNNKSPRTTSPRNNSSPRTTSPGRSHKARDNSLPPRSPNSPQQSYLIRRNDLPETKDRQEQVNDAMQRYLEGGEDSDLPLLPDWDQEEKINSNTGTNNENNNNVKRYTAKNKNTTIRKHFENDDNIGPNANQDDDYHLPQPAVAPPADDDEDDTAGKAIVVPPQLSRVRSLERAPNTKLSRSLSVKSVAFRKNVQVHEITTRTKEEARDCFLSQTEYFFIKRRAKAQAKRCTGYPKAMVATWIAEHNYAMACGPVSCSSDNEEENDKEGDSTRGLDMVDDVIMEYRNRNRKGALDIVLAGKGGGTSLAKTAKTTGGLGDELALAKKKEGSSSVEAAKEHETAPMAALRLMTKMEQAAYERIAQDYQAHCQPSAIVARRWAELDTKQVENYLADLRAELGLDYEDDDDVDDENGFSRKFSGYKKKKKIKTKIAKLLRLGSRSIST
jgi:hypothetical protein